MVPLLHLMLASPSWRNWAMKITAEHLQSGKWHLVFCWGGIRNALCKCFISVLIKPISTAYILPQVWSHIFPLSKALT